MPGQFDYVKHKPYISLHGRIRASKKKASYNFHPIPLPNDSCPPVKKVQGI